MFIIQGENKMMGMLTSDSFKEFVKVVSEFQKVLLIAPKQSDFENFKDIKNVEFFKCDTNDTWIRDFGAIDIVIKS